MKEGDLLAEERMAEAGEFGCIRRICRDLLVRPERVAAGAGDDGAVYHVPAGWDQVISTDTMVEGIHFTEKTMTPYDVGWKLGASNFSDMAAMGAEAAEFVVSAALPAALPLSWMERCYDGLRAICRRYGVNILGGDITGSLQGVVLTGTIIGDVPAGQALYRSGALPGDVIAVTGRLGSSAAGLDALLQGLSGWEMIKKAHRRPCPQLAAGRWLREHGAHSANDISDGLSSEANEIAAASSVVMKIDGDAVPLLPEMKDLAAFLGKDPLSYALNGGEDYQLVFTLPEETARLMAASFPVTVIGRVLEKAEEGAVYLVRGGRRERLLPEGYDHFPHHS